MTQEEKQLLFKDLCARLPYNIIVNVDNGKYREDMKLRPCHFESFERWDIKPYLRPMSSMTKEECEECMPLFDVMDDNYIPHEEWSYRAFDWLNANHFDYHGLIGKGLALEAPEGMYVFIG